MSSFAVCIACGAILESKHRHDYVTCPCPNKAMLDGGNDYVRSGAVDMRLHRVCKTLAEAKRLRHRVLQRNFDSVTIGMRIVASSALPGAPNNSEGAEDKTMREEDARAYAQALMPAPKKKVSRRVTFTPDVWERNLLTNLAEAEPNEWFNIWTVSLERVCKSCQAHGWVEVVDRTNGEHPELRGQVFITPAGRRFLTKLNKESVK